VIAKGVDCDTTHFRIFACRVIFGNEGLRLIANCLLKRTLPGDCSLTSGLSATSRLFDVASMPRPNSTELGGAFALGQRPVEFALKGL
jgi:hypothetical protein